MNNPFNIRRITFHVSLLLLLALAAAADITIDGESLHVETDAYTVQFDRGVITHLHNKLTGETYTLPLGIEGIPIGKWGRTGILRTKNGNVYTRESILTEARKIAPLEAEILFRQGGNEITLNIEVEAHTGDLLIGGNAISDTAGTYGFQWGCENLDITKLKLILPATVDKLSMLCLPSLQKDSIIPDSGRHNSQSSKANGEAFSSEGQMKPSNSKGWIAKKIARASHSTSKPTTNPLGTHSPPRSPSHGD